MIISHPDFIVSIHCMTYNHALYIEDAMNGFCMQETSFPFLAIICDDASTDGEQDVIRKYLLEHFNTSSDTDYQLLETEEAQIVYAQHKTNSNCSFLVIFLKTNYYSQKKDKSHIWKDWEESAKYIALCEGDDYWTDPQKLQKQVDFLENNPEYSMCFHQANEYIEEDAAHIITHGELPTLNVKDYSGNEIIKRWTIPTASVVYCKHIINNEYLDRVNSKKYMYGDIILFLSLAEVGKIRCVSTAPMSVYRRHVGGVTLQTRNDWGRKIKHLENLKNDFKGKYQKECNSELSWMYFDYFTSSFHQQKIQGLKYLVLSFLRRPKTCNKLIINLIKSKFI